MPSKMTSPTGVQDLTIINLLQRASQLGKGLSFYGLDYSNNERPEYVSYASLLERAHTDAQALHRIAGIENRTVLLLHFDNHYDNIRWFWAATLAGYLPCISTPFAADITHKTQHIAHLNTVLENPIALVNGRTEGDFPDSKAMRLILVESLETYVAPEEPKPRNFRHDGLTALTLTSGSTGNAKAVCFTDKQMIASIAGKTAFGNTSSTDIYFNWVALDHAVSLIEMHLHAIFHAADQVQVNARDLLLDPTRFLSLVHEHRVTYSFAPNFFLGLVLAKMAAAGSNCAKLKDLDLTTLRSLNCGGEACDTQTIVDFTALFRSYGSIYDFVHPGYGLSESCAGCVLAHDSPSYDVAKQLKYTSLGKAIKGCEIRVVKEDGNVANDVEAGELQLKGPVIFSQYYNNPQATDDAFTVDGWFKTGDKGYLDADGKLNLTGRTKELLIINGVNYYPYQLEQAIEQAQISGLLPSYTVVFAHRPDGAQTEGYCVLYCPGYHETDVCARVEAETAIAKVGHSITKIQPFRVIPLPEKMYQKSSIGKLSRNKIKQAFEDGGYDAIYEENRRLVHNFRMANRKPPSTQTEVAVVNHLAQKLELDANELSVDSNIFQLGVTSLDLFSMTTSLKKALNLTFAPDFVSILRNPTVSGIAQTISADSTAIQAYDPIVPLQTAGDKTPLFIIHPAAGNILAFLKLAQYFHDRPIYGIRATGVKPGERFFASFAEMGQTYKAAIRKTQPEGPYAIAGYSLGSTIAFETAKLLEAEGQEVKFLGCLDSPPDILPLVGHLTWSATLVMVSFFYEIITEEWANVLLPKLFHTPPEEALDFVMAQAPVEQLENLQLDREGLKHVADITSNFGRMAEGYAPKGKVATMDVFVVEPLDVMAADRDEWINKHLVQWANFVEERACTFHQCDGGHANMLTTKYVHSFQRKLKAALAERGL